MREEYKFSDLTQKIIGSAMRVHSALGNGFQEVIYQRALGLEMTAAGLEFARELEIPIHYSGQEIGTRRADFLVEGKVLEAYRLEIGLLLNIILSSFSSA